MQKEIKGVSQAVLFAALTFSPAWAAAAAPVGIEVMEEVEVARFTPAEEPLQFSVQAGAGFLSGELNEYVYAAPELPKHRLSELTWNVDRLLMGRFSASVDYRDWLTFTMDSWWKLSDGSGSMEDSDWRVVGEDWTDWSSSDTDITSASILDVNANMTFFRRYNYVLQGILGLKRDHFEMVASGGRFIYSTNGFRNDQGRFPDEAGATYEQTMTAPYLGLGFSAVFTNNISLSGRVTYSPFVKGEATDNHHMRNLVTEDEISGGDLFTLGFSVGWAFRENFVWNISTGYQRYENTRGDSTYRFYDTGEVVEHKDGIGMSQEMVQFSSSVTYTF